MNNRVVSIAAETFQEATCRKRVRVRMACDEVIQMKNRKMTVPCDSSKGMRRTPCVTNRISRGIKRVVTNPVNQVKSGQALFVDLMVDVREMRFLPGLVNDVAAIQEHRRLEEPVRDQMEHRQGKGAEAAFHDHVAHLPDRGKPERLLDVVLRQHHGGAQDGGERPDHEARRAASSS